MNKEQKEFLRNAFEEVWSKDSSMIDYCVKESDGYVVFDNGFIFAFEKPRIETSFCFGYSLSRYDSESYDNANNMVEFSKTNEQYFIDENIKQLTVYDMKNEYIALRKYEDSKFVYLVNKRYYEDRPYMFRGEVLFELSKDEIKRLIEENNNMFERFKKRLNTYLKKYGLSKIKSWSYWRDE